MYNEEYFNILSDNLDSKKCKRGGALFYGGQYFSWGCVQMTLILRSKNDPHSHYSTGVIIRRYTGQESNLRLSDQESKSATRCFLC